MNFQEFLDKTESDLLERINQRRKWLHRRNEVLYRGVEYAMKVNIEPEPQLPEMFSASHWTVHQLKLRSRESYDIYIDYSKPFKGRFTLFGYPVESRDGLDDYDITILPEN